MAKVAFSKLGLKLHDEIVTIEFNGQSIEIVQYLPVNEKLDLIAEVINKSADDNNFANPLKIDVYATIGIIEYYSNITFTEKQKENITKLYDMVISGGLYEAIVTAIPGNEINALFVALHETIEAVYKYRNSVLGLLDAISADYSNLNFDAAAIQQKLADPNNMALIKDVLTKLG